MKAHDGRDRKGEADHRQNVGADRRMALHDFVLGGREPAGLVENVLGNGQLSHVVQERGGLDRLNFTFVLDAQRAREMNGAVLHAPRVVVRDFIFGVDGVCERLN